MGIIKSDITASKNKPKIKTDKPKTPLFADTITNSWVYLAVFFLFVVLHLVTSYSIIKNYFPTQDFLSFIVYSTNYVKIPDFSKWFTEGFSRYFIFSPEWSSSFSNYIRPFPNFVFFCEYLLWGANWSGYLFFTCLVNSLGILIVFILCNKFFKLSFTVSLLASFVMFLTGFRLYLFYCPGYVTDAMAAIFLGIAFSLILKRKYIWTALALTFAVFSKEFGMFGPFAAIMTYLMVEYNEKKRISKNIIIPIIVLLIPAVLWFGIRKLFGGGLSGNYGYSYMSLPLSFDLQAWKPFIIKTIRTLFHWPIGWPVNEMRFGAGYEISDIVSGKIFLDFKYTHILAVLNPIFGACFLFDIVQGLRKNRDTLYSQLTFYMLPWILGIYALLMLTLDFLGIRYGYTYFMLVTPFSFYMIIRSKIKWRRLLYISYIVVLSVVGLISLKTHYFKSDNQIAFYQHSKQLSELIQKAYSEDPTRPIYLINDVSGTWGNYYLGIFATRDMDVNFTVLNSVWILEDFLSDKSTGDHYVNITKNNDTYTCSIKIPDNRVFFFYGADDSMIMNAAIKNDGNLIWNRSEKLKYVFYLIPTKGVAAPYGNKMEICIKDKDPVFIYYSFEDNSYKMIEY